MIFVFADFAPLLPLLNMTARFLIMFLIVCAARSVSLAYDTLTVPPFTESGASTSLLKKSLKKATLVEMDPFTVMVPKGWTFNAAGLSQKTSSSLMASPTPMLEQDDTYFAVTERKAPPAQSTEERFAKFKNEHPDWKVTYETLNNTKWLMLEYAETDKRTSKNVHRWVAYTIRDGKDYWMMAGAPVEQKKYAGLLRQIMAGVTFRNKVASQPQTKPAPPGVKPETAAPAPLTAPANVASKGATDLRLRDTWQIVGYKMDDGPGMWSDEEAQSLVGTQITFKDNQVYFGNTVCSGVARQVEDHDLEKNLLREFNNPCGAAVPGGPVFTLARRSCSKGASFPPYLTFESDNGVVAFGDAVSFCLKRTARRK